MGNYNPYAPIILGQEWVPIREENLVLSPTINSVEAGHGFTLESSRTLQSMRFYVNESAPQISNQVFTAAIYRRGTEASTGPIRSVLIPVNNGGITGTGVSFVFSTNVATALGSADDIATISFVESGVTLQKVGMFFAVNSYPELIDKRILAVNLRYSFSIDPIVVASTTLSSFITLVAANGSELYGNLSDDQGSFDSNGGYIAKYGTMRLGEINPFFDKTSAFVNRTSERLPWTYAELQRLEASAANRLQLLLTVQLNPTGDTNSTSAGFGYAALEVFFCEEQRLYIGSGKRSVASSALVTDPVFTGIGVTILPARTMGSYTLNPTVPPGDYTITLASPDLGEVTAPTAPQVNALREYYAIPPHPGVQINIPAPVDETKLGDVFTQETTHVLPQLSIHTSGGPLTEVHVYGRQAVAQVYGSIVAEQNIFDDVVGVSTSYTQVRFVARRFGETTQSLDFAGLNALSTSTASITPTDFDALDEVLDGWKKVTLRLSNPAVMGTLAAPDPVFRWSSAAETAGNRWEILGAVAPAISGLPGNLRNLVASPHQLSAATYGAPTSGSTVALTWMPGYAPVVSGSTADPTADAFLIFSTDPPAVSGFAVTVQSQAVSGIGPDCGVDPCCIPSAIFYNEVVWSPLSLAPSGFGFYELQRMDELTDWETIMKATDLTLGTFNDYEARVALESQYRIRAVNVYEFAGPWSDTIAETIDEPGVTIGCGEGGHLLIFTSNSQQDGSINLAYSTVWEGTVNEDFEFPETGDVILQRMYGKNFVTAFRPLERGGERFSRTLLVQAAAIAPPTLGDFTALRDLAWDQVPYVCVRDEDGNRWFATIFVPSGRVQLNRTIYMAPITVQEVTDIPFPVDP